MVIGADLRHERRDPTKPLDRQERHGIGEPTRLRRKAGIGPAQRDGGVTAIGQTNDQVRVRTTANADDVNLLAIERMMRMGHPD